MRVRFLGTPGAATSPVGVEGVQPMGNPQQMPTAPRRLPRGRFRPGLDNDAPIADIFDESRYVKLNGSLLVPIGLASTNVLPAPNQLRNFVGFRNASATANIYVEFGNTASTNSWLYLIPNTMMILDDGIPQDEIFAIADAASAFLVVVQSSTPGRSL